MQGDSHVMTEAEMEWVQQIGQNQAEAPRTSELITAATTVFPLLLASVCNFCSPGLLQLT